MLDSYNRKLLKALQADSRKTDQDYADIIGLSTTPTARRLKMLEEQGYIRRHVALLDPDRLGLKTTLFVSIKTRHHDDEWLERFSKGVARIPEVVEFYRMGGDIDYLLKVVLPQITDYDDVYKRIISIAPLSEMSAYFAMEAIKNTTELPIDAV